MPICGHENLRILAALEYRQTSRETNFLREQMTLIAFRRLTKYKRTWINYRIDMADAVLLGKNAKYGDWEPGTNQGNI